MLSRFADHRRRAPDRRAVPPLFIAWAIAIVVLLLPLLAYAQDDGAGYRLGAEDKVRLKVFEWRPSQDQIFEWKALNDEFIVSADGMLSVPLAGEVSVQGLAPSEAARLIADRLHQRLGLSAPPDVSIDMIQYRPFFVAGDVVHPGPFPYHPGLTVLEAISIAGGALRPADLGLVRFGRDIITEEGELSQLAREYDAFLLRRARLQAEVNGEEMFKVPAELDGPRQPAFVTKMMQAETLILQSRNKAFVNQTQALQELKMFLGKEGDSLDAQLSTIDTQMALINKELTNIAPLVEKGVVTAPRELALQRSVAQIQGDRLSMQTNKLRVQEEISKADLALIQLRNSRTTDASVELRDTQIKIDETIGKTQTGGKLLFESKVTAPGLVADYMRKGLLNPKYTIVRTQGGQPQSIDAEEATSLQPGDTVKVTQPRPTDMAPEAQAGDSDPQSVAVQ